MSVTSPRDSLSVRPTDKVPSQLQYVYRRPRYRKNTILFVTCLFGIAFISLGNMAGNSISFALRVLQAAGVQNPENGAVRGIAIGVATFACFIHTFSRRGGIWLNNILAAIKLCMLLLIIVTAIIVGAGGLPNTKNQIVANTTPSSAFGDASQDSNGYALAFLSISGLWTRQRIAGDCYANLFVST